MTFPLVSAARLNPVDPPGTWNSRGERIGTRDVLSTVTPLDGTDAAVENRLAVQKNAVPAVDTGVMRTT
jgi:hypothetical protein